MVESQPAADPRLQRGALSGADRWRRIGGLMVGLVALFGLGLVLSTRFMGEPPPSFELDVGGRLVVLPFATEGARGDGWQTWGLAALATEGLAANASLEVVPLGRLHGALEMRQLAEDPADRPRLRQLAAALGGESVIDVRSRRSDGRFRLEVEVYRQGRSGGAQSFEADNPMEATGLLIAALADRVLGPVARVPLEQVMPADPFVRRLYAEGVSRSMADGAADARPYFEIALRHAPNFALARLRLVESLRLGGEIEAAS
ncbi:MAG: hypothetical protein AAF725_05105, partial [Acidobacteriota bacterium]